ncbi:hypothetical protein C8J57DRAFT_1498478 [Mycena rebaudengoi]|nr:hypothetical protein C8J57DRAFT_1498478 [Mycena rebaudengoi]
MLQMTIASKHDIEPEGIGRVMLKFSSVTDVEFDFVFITPSKEVGERMSSRKNPISQLVPSLCPNTLNRDRPKVSIPVGYAVATFINAETAETLIAEHHATLDYGFEDIEKPMMVNDS